MGKSSLIFIGPHLVLIRTSSNQKAFGIDVIAGRMAAWVVVLCPNVVYL